MPTTVYGGGGQDGFDLNAGKQITTTLEAVPAKPSYGLGDGTYGMYGETDNQIAFGIANAKQATMDASWIIRSQSSPEPGLRKATASDTVPNICPRTNDTNSGIGSQAVDNISIIAGGLEGVRVEDPADLTAAETSLWVYDDDNGQIEQVTVGAADSGGSGFKYLRIAN